MIRDNMDLPSSSGEFIIIGISSPSCALGGGHGISFGEANTAGSKCGFLGANNNVKPAPRGIAKSKRLRKLYDGIFERVKKGMKLCWRGNVDKWRLEPDSGTCRKPSRDVEAGSRNVANIDKDRAAFYQT